MNLNLKIKTIKPMDDGVEYSIEQFRNRDFRIGLLTDQLSRFEEIDADKGNIAKREYSLSRTMFCLAQGYYMDALPADYDTWPRAKRRTFILSPEGERVTGGWETELFCVKQAGGERYKGVFEVIGSKAKRTTFMNIVSAINSGVEAGFNPASVSDGGAFKYQDIPSFKRAITAALAEEKKSKEAIAAATAREAMLQTEQGKFDAAVEFVGEFLAAQIRRAKNAKALNNILFGQHMLQHTLEQLAKQAHAFPVEEIGTLLREAQTGVTNILKTGKPDAVEETPVPASDAESPAYQQGFAAYGSVDLTDCEYDKGTPEHTDWRRGWKEARDLEEQDADA